MVTRRDYGPLVQGDRWVFSVDMPPGCFSTDTIFWMQLKRSPSPYDPGYGIASTANLKAVPLSDTSASFTFNETVTALIDEGDIWHQIKMRTDAGGVVTVYEGRIRVEPWSGEIPAAPTFVSVAGETEFGFETEGAFGDPAIANAGGNGSLDILGATPYSLNGSATGTAPITYLWTKLSGPGLVSFADATDPHTTARVDVDGVYVLDLAATNAAGTTHAQMTLTVTATLSALLTRMATGSRTAIWYEVDVNSGAAQTIDGSGNFSQLNDLGAGAYHAAQSTAGSRPQRATAQGPAGKTSMNFQDVARHLINTSIALAANKALFIVAVIKSAAAVTNQFGLFNNNDPNASTRFSPALGSQTSGGNKFFIISGTNNDANQTAALTAPVHDLQWHKWDFRFAAGVVPVGHIDGRALTPLFTTVTGLAAAVESIVLGRYGGFSGGAFYCAGVFESVSTVAGAACLSEEAAISYYTGEQTSLYFVSGYKWLGFEGQSNAARNHFTAPLVPPKTNLFREATDSTSLGVGAKDWGPLDPHGWIAGSAANQLSLLATTPSAAMVWFQGETDAISSSTTYSADLQALIAQHDALVGHTNTHWAVVKLNVNGTFTSGTNIALIRAGQVAAQAAMPTRISLVSVDDVALDVDGVHYTQPNYAIIWARCLAAIATHYGDTSWNP